MARSKRGPDFPNEEEARQAGSEASKEQSLIWTADMSKRFSTSVMEVAKTLLGSGPVSRGTMIRALLERHSEYGDGVTDELLSGVASTTGQRQPVEDWLADVESLYDRKRIRMVDGRMVVIGLSILDSDVATVLRRDDFLGNVVNELIRSEEIESLDELFNQDGLKKWHALEARLRLKPQSMPNHSDDPSLIDRLGREAFAEAIALRLRRIRYEADNPPETEEEGEPGETPQEEKPPKSDKKKPAVAGPFMLHIHGPWGAGKSTLLGFMKKHLRKVLGPDSPARLDRNSWIVVDFNAWRHQRLKVPWWSLMDAVFRTSVKQLKEDGKQDPKKRKGARRLHMREWRWRFLLSTSHYLVSLALFAACVGFILWAFGPWSGSGDAAPPPVSAKVSEAAQEGPQAPNEGSRAPGREGGSGASPSTQAYGSDRAKTAGEWAKYMGALITLGVGIWTFVRGLCQSLIPGSEHAAQAFLTCSADPLGRITRHFSELVEWIGQPVAIFIDDLDRCQADYAVELLEGIQTLFKKATVTFVVAADRRWLCSSYETVYNSFKGTVGEPARPLGYLFLEKTFQLSVALPRLAPKVQEDYWHYLLRLKGADRRAQFKRELEQARQEMSKLKDERDILAELGPRTGKEGYGLAFRQAAVVRLAAPEVEAHTEHFLMNFGRFLEPNPRAMKRFANAYAAQRALDILRGGADIEPGVLALWTIVVLRWPLLATYVERNPGIVTKMGKKPAESDEVPVHLTSLFTDNEVKAVFSGKKDGIDAGVCLGEKEISQVSGLRTS
jgi:hypothetical protein